MCCMGLVAPRYVAFSQTKDLTRGYFFTTEPQGKPYTPHSEGGIGLRQA